MAQYKSEARWNKAVQHLRDNGELTGTPKDIGPLIKEVRQDIIAEEKENIKETLWGISQNDFLATATNGLPQFYKEQLIKGNINAVDGPSEEEGVHETLQDKEQGISGEESEDIQRQAEA